jgi:hypothetical protein
MQNSLQDNLMSSYGLKAGPFMPLALQTNGTLYLPDMGRLSAILGFI